MTLRIKVDKDLPAAAVERLRAAGHDAVSVSEQRLGGMKDSALWKIIQIENRFLVTADKGFGDIRAFPPGTHAGVLVLRPDEDGIRPIVDLLDQILAQRLLDDLSGTVAVATPRGLRMRRA